MMRRPLGFSLIEAIMAMTIVSLLAVIAIPRASRLRERSTVASMRAVVQNLAVLEESYFYDHAVYTSDLGALASRGSVGGVGVELQVREATNIGWSVTASHAATLQQCHLFVGSAAPVGTATEDGRVHCQ